MSIRAIKDEETEKTIPAIDLTGNEEKEEVQLLSHKNDLKISSRLSKSLLDYVSTNSLLQISERYPISREDVEKMGDYSLISFCEYLQQYIKARKKDNRKWCDHDLTTLKGLWDSLPFLALLRYLDRSPVAVYLKLLSLGLINAEKETPSTKLQTDGSNLRLPEGAKVTGTVDVPAITLKDESESKEETPSEVPWRKQRSINRRKLFKRVQDSIKSESKSIHAVSKETNLEWKTVKNAVDLLLDLGVVEESLTKIKGKEVHLYRLTCDKSLGIMLPPLEKDELIKNNELREEKKERLSRLLDLQGDQKVLFLRGKLTKEDLVIVRQRDKNNEWIHEIRFTIKSVKDNPKVEVEEIDEGISLMIRGEDKWSEFIAALTGCDKYFKSP